jgi:hypothetical protein
MYHNQYLKELNMSTEEDKFKKSKRILKDENAIRKQLKIAKAHNAPVESPHQFAKHHAMNCGNPNCVMCGNPRKVWNEKTIQEKRFEQTEQFDND